MSLSERTQYYLAGAIADSTSKAYDRAFRTWEAYALQHSLPLLPVNPVHLANCLTTIADSSGSMAAISTLVAAVARQHWDRFLPSPTENFSFRRLLQGFRRRLAKPVKPKDPLTPEILSSAIQLVRSSGRLQEWRTVARMCLAFYAGCRWSDASQLKVSHLQFVPEGVNITIPKSKTDQLQKGDTVFINYAEHQYCPVTLLQDYLARLRYGDRDGFLQPKITSTQGIQSGLWNTQVSYSTALSDLKLLMSSLGYDPSKFGEHSGRRGGATAASDAGVDWPDLMLHGRWRSATTPIGYLANTRKRQKRVATALARADPGGSGSASSAASPSALPRGPTTVVSANRRHTFTFKPLPLPVESPSPASRPRIRIPKRSNPVTPDSRPKRRSVQVRRPASSPIPIPRTHSPEEIMAASTLASLIHSPPPHSSADISPSTLEVLFDDDNAFDLMII